MHFFSSTKHLPKKYLPQYAPVSGSDSGDEAKDGLLGTADHASQPRNTFWRRWSHFIIIQVILFGLYLITVLYLARQLRAEKIHGPQLVSSAFCDAVML